MIQEDSKDREIMFTSKTVCRKIRECCAKEKMIDTECENNVDTVPKELISSESVGGSFLCIILLLLLIMNGPYRQPSLNKFCRFTRSI